MSIENPKFLKISYELIAVCYLKPYMSVLRLRFGILELQNRVAQNDDTF